MVEYKVDWTAEKQAVDADLQLSPEQQLKSWRLIASPGHWVVRVYLVRKSREIESPIASVRWGRVSIHAKLPTCLP